MLAERFLQQNMLTAHLCEVYHLIQVLEYLKILCSILSPVPQVQALYVVEAAPEVADVSMYWFRPFFDESITVANAAMNLYFQR
jgi:hypothetical protein